MEKRKQHEELILEAKNFFDAYKKELGQSIRKADRIATISFFQLSEFSPILSEKIIEKPEETIAIMETALEETGLVKSPRVRLTDLPKTASIKVSEIRAKHLDQ